MTKSKEIRSNEYRATANNERMISGYALKFNQPSQTINENGIRFIEYIEPQAITQAFVNSQDVKCYWNHLNDKLLARSNRGKGTLTLKVDSIGLFYSFKAKETALGEEVYQAIKSGDVFGSSFAFIVAQNGDNWTKQDNGTYIRKITKISVLEDVSPVITPAYQSSTVSARFNDYKTNSKAWDEHIKQYYDQLRKQINK